MSTLGRPSPHGFEHYNTADPQSMTWAKAVLWQHGKFQQRAAADSGHLRNPRTSYP